MAFEQRQRELGKLGSVLHGAGLLATLALLALAAWVVVAPLEARRAESQRQAHKLERLSAGRLRIERQHAELTAELEAVQRRKAELRRRITDGAREGEFLRQISEVTTAVGLRLVSFQPGGVAQRGQYGSMRVQLACDGRFESICRFLAQLDELPRLATIERMDIASPARGEIYSFKLTLDIYFASSSSVAASVTAETDAASQEAGDA
jgi:Tfp pilus assembly protein PilO